MDHYDNANEEKTCLRNRHIVLVGDSITRYTYLNLVNYIEVGKWAGDKPLSEVEIEWSNWTSFYEASCENNMKM